MVVRAADLLDLCKAVDYVDSQKESFGQQLELHVDLDKPLNQDLSHLNRDICLILDAGGRGQVLGLGYLHVPLALSCILSNRLGVMGFGLVMGQELLSGN